LFETALLFKLLETPNPTTAPHLAGDPREPHHVWLVIKILYLWGNNQRIFDEISADIFNRRIFYAP
jgi:hypothetical protein